MSDGSVESLAEQQLRFAARSVGPILVLLTTGCAVLRSAQPVEPPRTGAVQAETVAVESVATPVAPAPPFEPSVAPATVQPSATAGRRRAPPGEPPQTGATQAGMVALETMVAPVPPSPPPVTAAKAQPAPKAGAPAAKAPAKAPALAAPAEPARKQESVAQVPAKQETAPPLDLKSLETRLKETKAIGVFTKLALKNQVDELLDQFRAFYQGRLKTSLAELRRSYDMLLLKVLALLQDADPPLAGAIATSREAIWSILADPAKFAAL